MVCMARLELNQAHVLCAAGTGKSLLLRHIIRRLPPESTYVTASTGLAAAALGGTTLNAFAGVGRADGGREAMRRAALRPQAAGRWRRAAVLIVDEVRMVLIRIEIYVVDGGREAMHCAAVRPQAAGRWRRAAVLIKDEVRKYFVPEFRV